MFAFVPNNPSSTRDCIEFRYVFVNAEDSPGIRIAQLMVVQVELAEAPCTRFQVFSAIQVYPHSDRYVAFRINLAKRGLGAQVGRPMTQLAIRLVFASNDMRQRTRFEAVVEFIVYCGPTAVREERTGILRAWKRATDFGGWFARTHDPAKGVLHRRYRLNAGGIFSLQSHAIGSGEEERSSHTLVPDRVSQCLVGCIPGCRKAARSLTRHAYAVVAYYQVVGIAAPPSHNDVKTGRRRAVVQMLVPCRNDRVECVLDDLGKHVGFICVGCEQVPEFPFAKGEQLVRRRGLLDSEHGDWAGG